MKPFTNDQLNFVILCLGHQTPVNEIITDFIEIYPHSIGDLTRDRVSELLSERIKKIKKKHAEAIAEVEAKAEGMVCLSPLWRVRYFRRLLSEANTENANKALMDLKIKLLKELRAEQKIMSGFSSPMRDSSQPDPSTEILTIEDSDNAEAEKIGPTAPLHAHDFGEWIKAGKPHFGYWRVEKHREEHGIWGDPFVDLKDPWDDEPEK